MLEDTFAAAEVDGTSDVMAPDAEEGDFEPVPRSDVFLGEAESDVDFVPAPSNDVLLLKLEVREFSEVGLC